MDRDRRKKERYERRSTNGSVYTAACGCVDGSVFHVVRLVRCRQHQPRSSESFDAQVGEANLQLPAAPGTDQQTVAEPTPGGGRASWTVGAGTRQRQSEGRSQPKSRLQFRHSSLIMGEETEEETTPGGRSR